MWFIELLLGLFTVLGASGADAWLDAIAEWVRSLFAA
jgi:hypothetical protein